MSTLSSAYFRSTLERLPLILSYTSFSTSNTSKTPIRVNFFYRDVIDSGNYLFVTQNLITKKIEMILFTPTSSHLIDDTYKAMALLNTMLNALSIDAYRFKYSKGILENLRSV